MEFKPVFTLHLADQPSSYQVYRYLQRHFHRRQPAMLLLECSPAFTHVALIQLPLTDKSGELAQQIIKQLKGSKNVAHFYLFRFQPADRDPSTKFDTQLIKHLFDYRQQEGLDYDFLDYFLLTNQSYLSFRDTGFWKRK